MTSLRCFIGPEGDVTTSEPDHARRLELHNPILTLEECEAMKKMSYKGWKSKVWNYGGVWIQHTCSQHVW